MTPGKKWKFTFCGTSLFFDESNKKSGPIFEKIVIHIHPRPSWQEIWNKLNILEVCQTSVKIIEPVKFGYVFHVEQSICNIIKENFTKIIKHTKPTFEIEEPTEPSSEILVEEEIIGNNNKTNNKINNKTNKILSYSSALQKKLNLKKMTTNYKKTTSITSEGWISASVSGLPCGWDEDLLQIFQCIGNVYEYFVFKDKDTDIRTGKAKISFDRLYFLDFLQFNTISDENDTINIYWSKEVYTPIALNLDEKAGLIKSNKFFPHLEGRFMLSELNQLLYTCVGSIEPKEGDETININLEKNNKQKEVDETMKMDDNLPIPDDQEMIELNDSPNTDQKKAEEIIKLNDNIINIDERIKIDNTIQNPVEQTKNDGLKSNDTLSPDSQSPIIDISQQFMNEKFLFTPNQDMPSQDSFYSESNRVSSPDSDTPFKPFVNANIKKANQKKGKAKLRAKDNSLYPPVVNTTLKRQQRCSLSPESPEYKLRDLKDTPSPPSQI